MRERWSTSPASVTESVQRLVDDSLAAWEPLFSALDDTIRAWDRGWGPAPGSSRQRRDHAGRDHHRHHGGCAGCRDRGHGGCDGCRDRCSCRGGCSDADVLVIARPGERRVVPLEIRNPRHRDVTVSVDVGPWTSCEGDEVAIEAVVQPSGELTVPACSSREVLLVLQVAGKAGLPDEQRGAGLRCCATLTSDIRINGCGTTLRVAVDVLPLDCASIEVTCCGCCC
ncbi:MAG TPA: hypothetical protein VMI11_07285 [Actinomycetes bacterium]|nr:hypothetical protein [Actinomycetes bacterium]